MIARPRDLYRNYAELAASATSTSLRRLFVCSVWMKMAPQNRGVSESEPWPKSFETTSFYKNSDILISISHWLSHLVRLLGTLALGPLAPATATGTHFCVF